MIIKAKYPKVGNEYVGFQGYGSQGNRNSTITNEDTLRTLVTVSDLASITDFDFYTAVDLWFTNQALAESTYGLIGNWNVSAVTNMSYAFSPSRNGGSVKATFNEDISAWDTSSVGDMSEMFFNAESFNQPLTFDTSNVYNMDYMFYQAESFNQPLNWDTSSVNSMSSMFRGASVFNQPLNWDVSSVTSMKYMFYQATLFNQPLNWDVSSITDMRYMFQSVNLSTVNYDLILVYWEAYLQTTFPSGVGYTKNISISFGNTQYTSVSSAETARASLISNFGWTINDGGSTM